MERESALPSSPPRLIARRVSRTIDRQWFRLRIRPALAHIFYFHVDVFYRAAYSMDGKLRDGRREKRKPVARGCALASRRGVAARDEAEKGEASNLAGKWSFQRAMKYGSFVTTCV